MQNLKNHIIYCPRSEKIIIFAICTSVAFHMVDGLVNRVLQIEFWDSLLTKGVYFGSILMATFYALKRFKKEMIPLPFFVMVLWLFSYLVFPINREILTEEIIFPVTTELLPLFIITLSVRDDKRLFESLRITSRIVIICGLIYLLLLLQGQLDIGYMEFSYNLLFSVMFLFIYAIKFKNKIDIIFTLSGIVMIFTLGSRGAMLAVIIGIVFYILINSRLSVKNILYFIPLTLITIFLSTNFLLSLERFNLLLQYLNINSRTLNLLLAGNASSDSGRGKLFEYSISGIINNPIIGTGMAGDREVLGAYTHNLFTELLLQYGLIVGSFFIFIIIYYLLKSFLYKNKNELYYVFFATFFSNGFMKLMFSSSYLMEPMFFVMLGLSFLVINKRRNLNLFYTTK